MAKVILEAETATRAGALLMDAAGMLRMEAEEWRARKGQIATGGEWTPENWKERCERIANINVSAATKMEQTAKMIAEAVSKVAA